MYATKDGRDILTRTEAQAVLSVLSHAVEVVTNFGAAEQGNQSYPEARLLAALHAVQDSGVTIDGLAALTAQRDGG